MASIGSSLQRIKDNPLCMLDRATVEEVCRECRHVWRDRQLDPLATIGLFIQQVVHGNTPCSEVRHIAGKSFTPQAYCEARARLPLAVYRGLLTAVHDVIYPTTTQPQHLWHGHRTFHVDGSSFSMPDTPELRKVFGGPRGRKKDAAFQRPICWCSSTPPRDSSSIPGPGHCATGDIAQTPEVHAHLNPGDILIGDDSFSSYAHMAMLQQQGLHGLFPIHHLRIVDFTKGRPHTDEGKNAVAGMPRSRWIKSLGKEDQLVEYFKPQQKALWMSQADYDALPESLIVRELRRTVTRPGLGHVTLKLMTTLQDEKKYPASELLELRLRRWDVETNLGHLKTTMKMDVLRCKTEAGVRKELVIFCIVYNCVRAVMMQAAHRQDVPVSRISFADAYKWIRHAGPDDTLPTLLVVPLRPNRAEPRCRKRRPKQYDLMSKPRDELRRKLRNDAKKA